jgi:hypothetical protein
MKPLFYMKSYTDSMGALHAEHLWFRIIRGTKARYIESKLFGYFSDYRGRQLFLFNKRIF